MVMIIMMWQKSKMNINTQGFTGSDTEGIELKT